MIFGYRHLGAALVKKYIIPRCLSLTAETATPICSVKFFEHHGFSGFRPSLPSPAGVSVGLGSIVHDVRSDSFTAMKPEGSVFSTFITSKVEGGIGASCLRCGAEERATSRMDGSAELNPVAGGRNSAVLMWHRGLKRKASSAKSPYAVMWVPDGMPLQRSYPNAGSVKTTSRRMRRMELRRQFQISEKGKKKEEIKESLRARDQMRIARWRAGVQRAKEWQDFLAISERAPAV